MFRPEKVIYTAVQTAASDHDTFIDALPRGVQMPAAAPELVRASPPDRPRP